MITLTGDVTGTHEADDIGMVTDLLQDGQLIHEVRLVLLGRVHCKPCITICMDRAVYIFADGIG